MKTMKSQGSVINQTEMVRFMEMVYDRIGMQGHLDDTQNIEQYMIALEKYTRQYQSFILQNWILDVPDNT